MVAIAPAAANTLAMPIFYQPLIDQQVVANISWGTPAGAPIPTVVDTGSYGFWVSGPDAIVNSGSPYLGTLGPCNQTVNPAFNWHASSSATGPYADQKSVFAYGGGGKIITCPYAVNDTMNFAGDYPPIENIQVAISSFTLIKDRSTTCQGAHYDKSILGLAAITSIGGGPQLHPELLRQGRLGSQSFSMWFDAPPADINAPQMGRLLLGDVPTDKHTGELVTVHNAGVDRADKGYYYVAMPEVRVSAINGSSAAVTIPADQADDGSVPDCLVDSGTWGLTLPTSSKEFFAATGLVGDDPFLAPRYPAPCADIPLDAGLEMVFPDQNGKTSATVKIPYRSMAQSPGEEPNTCRLNLQLSDIGCTLGGTFYASAFIAHNDAESTLQIAQGAVAGSA